MEQGFAALLE